VRGEEAVFGGCPGPCRRRFVRVRGLNRAFSGSRARVSAGLRRLFSDGARGLPGASFREPYNCSGSGLTPGVNRGIIESSLGLPPVFLHAPGVFSSPELTSTIVLLDSSSQPVQQRQCRYWDNKIFFLFFVVFLVDTICNSCLYISTRWVAMTADQ